jgi:murein DD-endopeptidase MepM/ murein hydrolase activator NlpD
MNRILFLSFLFCILQHQPAVAQLFSEKKYPKGYFAYPVGAPVGLSANFGELRPNHWHMGLDCKTEKRENLPILAAADGYVAKVKIEPYGFGRAIYINHPNGLTTLYAHLNDFYPELEAWIKEQQYAAKSWRYFPDSIPANLFPVKKGQFIAKSGNTGGSQGPHLHFEIRDTRSDKVLNPQLFGFNIPDQVAPKINRLAVYDRCQSVYEQSPRMVSLTGGGNYGVSGGKIFIKTERVSFAIAATDAVNGNPNPNGIYEAVIYDNEKPLCGFQLDSIGYDETRYLNAHIDYRMKTAGGSYVQHLSQLPGYTNGIYRRFNNDGGVIDLSDRLPHQVKIVVKDAAGNSSILQFVVQNTDTSGSNSRCNDTIPANRSNMFFPQVVNIFDNPDLFFFTSAKSLYDSIRFRYSKTITTAPNAYSDVHNIHTPLTPVHDYFPVNLKPSKPVPDQLKDRLIIKRMYQGKSDVFKAKPKGDWYGASFRGFGQFVLLADVIPPVITPVGWRDGANLSKSRGISIAISDDQDEIKNFRAMLNGEWLLFSNDKGRVFKHVFDERCGPGAHELKIYIEDEAGNSSEKIFRFTR